MVHAKVDDESALAVARLNAELSRRVAGSAIALEILAGQLGVDSDDVIAFGDMPNDLPMLAWAGHSVATSNAHPDVLAVVDRITDHCDADGVAMVLEELFAEALEV